jgi:RES domain-containing protein
MVDGRWHGRGRHLDYAAENRSLAVLERLVHYKRFDQLEAHVIVTAVIPDELITDPPALPHGWDAVDSSPAAQALGNDWCDRQTSPALRVPSAISAGEFNLLVNARHREWRWSWVSGPVPFAFDWRLREMAELARRHR